MVKITALMIACLTLMVGCVPTTDYSAKSSSTTTITNEPTIARSTTLSLMPTPTAEATLRPVFKILGEWPIVGSFRPQHNLYTVNGDGSELTQLTNNQQEDVVFRTPVWSPDGRQILFTKIEGDSDKGIYLINSDGSRLKQLTDNVVGGYAPVWSPDGQRIAFMSKERIDGPSKIFLMRKDGSDLRRLTQTDDYCESFPRWSPAGDRLVFEAERCAAEEPDSQLRIVNVDGTGERRLTPQRADIRETSRARWSPTGEWIAYDIVYTEGGAWFNLITPDGSKILEPRSTEAGMFHHPMWSPDGSHLAFEVELTSSPDKSHLGVMNIPALTWHTLDFDIIHAPDARCWLPNGRQLAIYIYEDDKIWIVNDDGSNPRSIAEGIGVVDCTPKQYIP